ncbi:MAG: type II toxin-antitoxin system RelB/DinJ family antitoxin [Bacteroidales bacterium]|nr:type II toxin-antitoxin system RelB/DinJ family antitoxin [Bacteroidales bacterium]
MATVATTIRLDSELKKRFDALCDEFGLTVNTAINLFVKSVVRTRSIPFSIKLDDPVELGMQALEELRAQAADNGLQDMTLDDINAEIAAARAERK